MKTREIEERIINKLLPKLEKKLEKRLEMIRKEEYPPEAMFKKKFIREVKAAQKRIRAGKGKIYTYSEFKKKFIPKAK
jgi:lipoate-protein ligase A